MEVKEVHLKLLQDVADLLYDLEPHLDREEWEDAEAWLTQYDQFLASLSDGRIESVEF
jgi:hypothetical protein